MSSDVERPQGSQPFPSREIALLWRIPFSSDSDPKRVETALRERIKELNCLYGVSQLAERHLHSLDAFLQDLVKYLPYSWQFPEITCSRVMFKDETYASNGFAVTDWRQSAQIYMFHEPVGEVAVFYLEERPPADEGPFLKEERALLDAVAEQIGTVATRISAELELQETNRQLTIERQALREANTALRIVLSRIEQEKQETRSDVNTNVDKVLKPILRALSAQLTPAQKNYVDMIEKGLDEITSPFVSHLSTSFRSLSPTEVAIANMIKNGMRTKEIADARGISEATVNRHREKIRRKLSITNEKANLATFLQSRMWEGN